MKDRNEPKQETEAHMVTEAQVYVDGIEESRSDPIAVTELATILAKDWCAQWGGWPSDHRERMAQIWAHRPAARKLFAAMLAVSKTDRAALCRALSQPSQ